MSFTPTMSTSANVAMSTYLNQLRRKQDLQTNPIQPSPGQAMAVLANQQPVGYSESGAPQFEASATLQLPQSGKTAPSAIDLQFTSYMEQRRREEEQFRQIQLSKRQQKKSRIVSVYPEPLESEATRQQSGTFVKEGFWAASPDALSRFPFPSPGERPWGYRDIFLPCLSFIESVLLKSPTSVIESSKSVESCLLCQKRLGKHIEFLDAQNQMTWRGSYSHYIEQHNIQPSNYFYNYIVAATNALQPPPPQQQRQ